MSADIISSRAMQWASKVQSIADQARDLTLEAAQSVGARYADESKAADILKLLEGRTDREKIDGMRRTIAISSKGTDLSCHFASVVKNVASSNLELRKLVYIYIARYAESQPDLALLSINTIQKALSDQNQIVRALALRVISSIRVTSISGIVLLSIKKCLSDSSAYVRKTAAMAIPKTNSLDPGLHTQLLGCLKSLLADNSPTVVASALEAHECICPGNIELLHPIYRRTCQTLSEMDEFAQVNILRILERYARRCFVDPTNHKQKEANGSQDFYDSDVRIRTFSGDLTLLIKGTTALLRSRNSATVLAACRVLFGIDSDSNQELIVVPMLALLRSSMDIRYITLTNIVVMALRNPSAWQAHIKKFFIYLTDPEYIWRLKLEVMTLIVSVENSVHVLPELAQYSSDCSNEALSKAAIQAICKCAQHVPDITSSCMDILFSHIRSDNEVWIGESVVAVRQLVQLNPTGHVNSIKTLVRSLEHISTSSARASIFWLVAEHLRYLSRIAPDVLRIGVKGFTTEKEEVRLQILTLAVKMYVLHSQSANGHDIDELNAAIDEADEARTVASMDTGRGDGPETVVKQDLETDSITKPIDLNLDTDSAVPKLYAYLCQLARYDISYDIRDRLRTYKILVSSPNWILTQKMLFSPKPLPIFTSASAGKEKYSFGSSSMLVDKSMSNYHDLPSWSTEVIGERERDVEIRAPVLRNMEHTSSLAPSRSVTPIVSHLEPRTTKAKSKLTGISSLDDFYASTSESSAEETEASEEDEEETESSEESESGSDETSDEEDSKLITPSNGAPRHP